MRTQETSATVLVANEGRQFTVVGSVMTYKATAEQTGGAYSLAVEITPPHGGLPLHVHHREDEAMYILDGEYEIQCGNQLFHVTAGTFVFLPKDIPTGMKTWETNPANFFTSRHPESSKGWWKKPVVFRAKDRRTCKRSSKLPASTVSNFFSQSTRNTLNGDPG